MTDYILDAATNSIAVLSPTEYSDLVSVSGLIWTDQMHFQSICLFFWRFEIGRS